MRRRMTYACKCGRWIKGRGRICSFCSLDSVNSAYDSVENPTLLLTNEIAEANIDDRLKFGFELLKD